MGFLDRERLDDGIEVVRMDRPEARNALGTPQLAELEAALAALAADETLRVLVLSTTSVTALCAGADVREPLDHAGGVARMEAFARVYAAMEAFPAPVVCVCVGNVVGAGAELAAAADLRVAGDNLKLMWAGARMGAPVGPARLVPLVGRAVAAELLFTSRVLDAHEAASLHLVHRTTAPEDAEPTAVALAREIAALPGARRIKQELVAFDLAEGRVAVENDLLVGWQRDEGGLPSSPLNPAA